MPLGKDTRILFVTGTDTGVGKTLVTGLLLSRLRQKGVRALALKPFCSGSRHDAELFRDLQKPELSLEDINPFYFPQPVAPLVAARKQRRQIRLPHAIAAIRSVATASKPRILLVEGAGGLLAPLGEGFTLLDVIEQIACEVTWVSAVQIVVVAANKLGTINHTLLTGQALESSAKRWSFSAHGSRLKGQGSHRLTCKVVLSEGVPRSSSHISSDISRASNQRFLKELLRPIPVFTIPWLGRSPKAVTAVETNARKLGHTLDRVIRGLSIRMDNDYNPGRHDNRGNTRDSSRRKPRPDSHHDGDVRLNHSRPWPATDIRPGLRESSSY